MTGPVEALEAPPPPGPRSLPVTVAGALYMLQGAAVLFGGGMAAALISLFVGASLALRTPGQPLYDAGRFLGTALPFLLAFGGLAVGGRTGDVLYAAGVAAMAAALLVLVRAWVTRALGVGAMVALYLCGLGLLIRALVEAGAHGAAPV